MLNCSDLSHRYGKTRVLENLTHDFGRGVTVITGPSGAGKTTLLRLCATVETPRSGTITWNGVPYRKAKRTVRSVLGYAPQRIDFPEDLTGLEFMLHVAALKNVPLAAAKQQASGLLGRLGLSRDADGRIQSYSGGMQRRLGLAQAFLGAPELLILDEPTAELDAQSAAAVHDLIFESGCVTLMTTHRVDGLEGRPHETLRIEAIG